MSYKLLRVSDRSSERLRFLFVPVWFVLSRPVSSAIVKVLVSFAFAQLPLSFDQREKLPGGFCWKQKPPTSFVGGKRASSYFQAFLVPAALFFRLPP
jgi:hypothetical protein